MRNLILLAASLTLASLADGAAAPEMPVPEPRAPHPRLLVSAESLAKTRELIAARQYPHILGWEALLKRIETTVVTKPYTGVDPIAYYHHCHPQGERARDLALAYHLGGREEHALAAIRILDAWSRSTPLPGTQLADDMKGSPGIGMYVGRGTFPMMYAADLLWDHHGFSGAPREAFTQWMKALVPVIKSGIMKWEEKGYYGRQDFQNHLAAHTLGLTAIATLLGDRELLQYAIDSPENPRDFRELIAGLILMPGDAVHQREPATAPAPQAGEIYDRYRHHTGPIRGLQYAHLSLGLLSMVAEIGRHNGMDLWNYKAPGGETLRLPYEFYADFYSLEDSSLKGGFYAGETKLINKGTHNAALFELGLARFSNSPALEHVIWVSDRAKFSDHLAGPLMLTHGIVLPNQQGLAPRPPPDAPNAGPVDPSANIPATPLPPHPRLILDRAGLDAMKSRALSGSPPWQDAWLALEKKARRAVEITPLFKTYTGTQSYDFYKTLLPQAQASRDLALAWWITGDPSYAEAARKILALWAEAEPAPGTGFAATPDELGKGMLIPRSILPMIWAYDILAGGAVLDESESHHFSAWLTALVPQIKDGARIWKEHHYFDHQYFQNHLAGENMGLIAIAVATGDTGLLRHAVNSLENDRDHLDLLEGLILMPGDPVYYREPPGAADPQAGEIIDRYRHFQMAGHFKDYMTYPNRGLQYCMLSSHLLAISAQILSNNGIDLWRHKAPGGESLELPFTFYAPIYAAMDSSLQGGFYSGETGRLCRGGDNRALFELAAFRYPHNRAIAAAIDWPGRATDESGLLGFEALIFGATTKPAGE